LEDTPVSSSPQNALLHSLYRSQQQRIDALFEDLLTRQINIPPGIRSTAGRSQNHLRDFLGAESERDENFPRVLTNVDSDFLGGSFARHTKKWPLDDIDIYAPLDGYNLFYFQNGQTLPYTVRSDGNLIWNPLLSGIRWMNGPWAGRTATFARIDGIPDGFGVINIVMEDGEWFGGGRYSLTISGLRAAFTERITDKNHRVEAYRKNMPGAPIWLLLFSGAGLPGGIERFVGIEKSSVAFDFDRIFFYSALAGRVIEIHQS
jgi:hypothetical protein